MQSKIALFLPHIGDGGLTRVMLTLLEGFISKGYPVDLVVTKNAKVDERKHLIPEGVNLIRLKSMRTATSVLPLASYLLKNKPRVLLSGGPSCNCVALIAKIITKTSTRVIITEHSLTSVDVFDTHKVLHKAIPFLVKKLYPRADSIVAVSKAVATDLSSFSGLPIEAIEVIYNPVVTRQLLEKASMRCNHPWLINKERPVILFVGRLANVKNLPLIIKSFYRVLNKIDCRLLVIGDGPEKNNIEKLIRDLKIEDNIDLVGYSKNPYPYIKAADVLVLASKWEGLPTVLIESMVLGTPVVATDNLDGAKEILENGKYGVLAGSNDELSLSIAIIKSFEVNNKEEIINRANFFTLEKSVDQYIKLISSQ